VRIYSLWGEKMRKAWSLRDRIQIKDCSRMFNSNCQQVKDARVRSELRKRKKRKTQCLERIIQKILGN
jgi:hypothetical protein